MPLDIYRSIQNSFDSGNETHSKITHMENLLINTFSSPDDQQEDQRSSSEKAKIRLQVVAKHLAPTNNPHQNKAAGMANENPLTSHILDTSKGLPASNVLVKLYKMGNDGSWNFVTEMVTDEDGRVKNLISATEFTPAVYKLYFDTKSYFTSQGEKTFYPYIEVVFEIEKPQEHYHVPILLNAYGFSTYRGS